MSNYVDIYKARVGHLGATPQERALTSGILEFRRYLKYSIDTVRGLTTLVNAEQKDTILTFDASVEIDKEDENRVSHILYTKLERDGGPTLHVGDLIGWNEDVWILWKGETAAYKPYQKFYMIKCNYFIKWVDKQGKLQGSWIYLLGSKDSKIKDNFRTWHSVITPQPNKYISLIMPHQLMAVNTEIMVLDEVWYLVDYDQSSVDGIIFMSFTESELNEQRDDKENGIANADQIADWSIEVAATRTVEPNTTFTPEFAIYKNGALAAAQPSITVSEGLVLQENGDIYVGETGGSVIFSYEGQAATQVIEVGEAAVQPTFVGDNVVKVASTHTYVLQNASNVDFVCSDSALASIQSVNNNECVVVMNSKNKLGIFTLTANCDGQTYTKDIKVVSLWQVI